MHFTLTDHLSERSFCKIIKDGLRVGGISKDNFDDHYTAHFTGGYCSAPQFRFTWQELKRISEMLIEVNKNISDAKCILSKSNAPDDRGVPPPVRQLVGPG